MPVIKKCHKKSSYLAPERPPNRLCPVGYFNDSTISSVVCIGGGQNRLLAHFLHFLYFIIYKPILQYLYRL